MRAVCRLWLEDRFCAEIADIVDVQRRRVGAEDERLWGEGVDEGRRVDMSGDAVTISTLCSVWRNDVWTYASDGSVILAVTLPVIESATLTMPSVPAEYSDEPSRLYASVRQLPLCRRVFQAVSMCPKPLSEANVASLSLSSLAPAGSLYVCTCPDARPTATIGSSGWIACANRSESSGIVHRFSNMVAVVVLPQKGPALSQLQLFCGQLLWREGAAEDREVLAGTEIASILLAPYTNTIARLSLFPSRRLAYEPPMLNFATHTRFRRAKVFRTLSQLQNRAHEESRARRTTT